MYAYQPTFLTGLFPTYVFIIAKPLPSCEYVVLLVFIAAYHNTASKWKIYKRALLVATAVGNSITNTLQL